MGHRWPRRCPDLSSPLKQINADNAAGSATPGATTSRPRTAWKRRRSSSTASCIRARPGAPCMRWMRARGRVRWVFDPKVDDAITSKVCCGIVNRGLAVAAGPRVRRLHRWPAVRARCQRPARCVWEVDTIVDHERGYTVTGSTYVAGDLVVIGNSGAELDARGYVTAYDVGDRQAGVALLHRAGEHARVRSSIPSSKPPRRPGIRSRVGKSALAAPCGTAWPTIAKLDLLYVGTGNCGAVSAQAAQPAAAATTFTSPRILAIDPKTGRLAWHYQTTPGDQWDYTATQKMILADLKIDGRERAGADAGAEERLLLCARSRDRRAAVRRTPYVPVNWATGRRSRKRAGRSRRGRAITRMRRSWCFPRPPAATTGSRWRSIRTPDSCTSRRCNASGGVLDSAETPFVYAKGGVNTGVALRISRRRMPATGAWNREHAQSICRRCPNSATGQPDTTMRGFLRAWDPVAQASGVAGGNVADSWVGQMSALWNGGGVMTTAGDLVFQGRSTGYLHVYRASDGQATAAHQRRHQHHGGADDL